MSAHHSHGSSSLPRRLACTASFLAESQCEELPESDDAVFGTTCHAALEWCVQTGKDAQLYEEEVDPSVTEEMMDFVQLALDKVRENVPSRLWDGRMTEQRVYFDPRIVPTPEIAFGTADLFFPDFDNRMLYVLDAKFGYRFVEADSVQLLALATGAQLMFYDIDEGYRFDTFSLTVLQPTLNHFPTKVIKWDELEKWGLEECRTKVLEGLDPAMAEYNPDAGVCTYCDAAPQCPARIEKLRPFYGDFVFNYFIKHGEMPVMFEDNPVLTDQHLAAIYPDVEIIAALMKDIDRKMTLQVQNGVVEVPGYSLGRKKTHRRMVDGVTAEILQEKFGLLPSQVHTTPKLKTPKQLESQLPSAKIDPKPRAEFEKLVFHPKGDFVLKKIADNPDHNSLVAGFRTTEK